MKMLRVEKMGFEECKPDKAVVRLIYAINTIHYIVKGSGYFNGTLLRAGEAFWTKKNRFIEYYPEPTDPWTYYWVHFNDDGFDEFVADCELPDCMHFRFENCEQMIAFCEFYNSFPQPSANRLLCENIAALIRSVHLPQQRTVSPVGVSYAAEAKKYMDNHFYQPRLTVDTIAQNLHISRSYLRDVFMREFGIAPREYLSKVRLTRAKELLIASEYPIGTIACSVGYDDIFQFSRFFSAHIGCSPSAYRKQGKQI